MVYDCNVSGMHTKNYRKRIINEEGLESVQSNDTRISFYINFLEDDR